MGSSVPRRIDSSMTASSTQPEALPRWPVADFNVVTGTERPAAMELVRLAFPRRMYTQSHFDYAAEVIAEAKQHAASVRGIRIVKQPPFLRHFTCECEWVK